MIDASSFWGDIGEVVLRIVAGILARVVCHLRVGSIAGLVLLCGSLSGWIGPVSAAQAEGLPDNRVYEMVTPPNNQNADAYVPKHSSGKQKNSTTAYQPDSPSKQQTKAKPSPTPPTQAPVDLAKAAMDSETKIWRVALPRGAGPR